MNTKGTKVYYKQILEDSFLRWIVWERAGFEEKLTKLSLQYNVPESYVMDKINRLQYNTVLSSSEVLDKLDTGEIEMFDFRIKRLVMGIRSFYGRER